MGIATKLLIRVNPGACQRFTSGNG